MESKVFFAIHSLRIDIILMSIWLEMIMFKSWRMWTVPDFWNECTSGNCLGFSYFNCTVSASPCQNFIKNARFV